VVASNLFADILSDIAAVITGSMGLAPSANINPERNYPSMFEPVHGAAFDIMGKGIANPLATIFAVAMLLEHLGEQKAAEQVNRAAVRVLEQRKVLTPDLGGRASTSQVGDEVVRLLTELVDAESDRTGQTGEGGGRAASTLVDAESFRQRQERS
jgi:tartrate dehydrogenase/decarboxylase/D-malate dehydrogenase